VTGRVEEYVAIGSAGKEVQLSLHAPEGDSPCPLVALLHGFKGFKDWGFFPDLAHRITEEGWAALRLSFSHNGCGTDTDAQSFTRLDLFERDRMSYRLLDLQSALRATGDRYPRWDGRLILFGHSLGGAVALLSMKSLDVTALVTLASVANVAIPSEQAEVIRRDGRMLIPNARTGQMMPMGIAALRDLEAHDDEYNLKAAARLHRTPWLILHGAADPTVPVEAAHTLQEWSNGSAAISIVEGADHVMNCRHPFEGATHAYDRMWAETRAFLAAQLTR